MNGESNDEEKSHERDRNPGTAGGRGGAGDGMETGEAERCLDVGWTDRTDRRVL